jgi:hypothetical protein
MQEFEELISTIRYRRLAPVPRHPDRIRFHMDEPYGITKEHHMIFNEASERYFKQRPKNDIPDGYKYNSVIQEIKTLNAMPTFPQRSTS